MPTGAATTTKLEPRGAYQTRAPPWRSSARTGVALSASARSAAPHAPAQTLLIASPYAVTARIQAGADGAPVIGRLLLLHGGLAPIVHDHRTRLLGVGRIAGAADRAADHRARQRAGGGVPRPRDRRADDGAGHRAHRGAGSRRGPR